MPLAFSNRIHTYTATAGQTVFTVTFPLFNVTDLTITRTRAGVKTVFTYPTDFAVVILADRAGATVTLTSPALVNDTIQIRGNMIAERQREYELGRAIGSKNLDNDFDIIQAQVQEIKRDSIDIFTANATANDMLVDHETRIDALEGDTYDYVNGVLDERVTMPALVITSSNIQDGTIANEDLADESVSFDNIASVALTDEPTAIAGTNNATLPTPLRVADAIKGYKYLINGTVPLNNVERFSNFLFVEEFGAIGDGVTNDRLAFNSAIAAIGTRGGVLKLKARKYYISGGDLVLPQGVYLEGEALLPGEGTFGDIDYTTCGTVILLNPSYTIKIGDMAGLRQLFVLNNLVKTPPTTPAQADAMIAAFSGTGITIAGQDPFVERVWIGGFNRAIDWDNTASNRERFRFLDIQFDCTNGIRWGVVGDFAVAERLHGWPFMTAHNSAIKDGTATESRIYYRSGICFESTGTHDFATLVSCNSYSYQTGFKFTNCHSPNFIGCSADGLLDSQTGSLGTVGFHLTGYGWNARFLNTKAHLCTEAFKFDQNDSTPATVEMVNTTSRWCKYHIRIGGNAIITSFNHEFGQTLTSSNGVIKTDASPTALTFHCPKFMNIESGTFPIPSTVFNFNTTATYDVLRVLDPITYNYTLSGVPYLNIISSQDGTKFKNNYGKYYFEPSGDPVAVIRGASRAQYAMWDTGGAANAKIVDIGSYSGTFTARFVNDAYNAAANFYNVTRSGTSPQEHQWSIGGSIALTLNSGGLTAVSKVKATAYRSQNITIGNNAVVSLTPPSLGGLLYIMLNDGITVNPTFTGLMTYRVGSSPQIVAHSLGGNCSVATGIPTGTTGPVSSINVFAATDGKLYFEGRVGGTYSYEVVFIGGA